MNFGKTVQIKVQMRTLTRLSFRPELLAPPHMSAFCSAIDAKPYRNFTSDSSFATYCKRVFFGFDLEVSSSFASNFEERSQQWLN